MRRAPGGCPALRAAAECPLCVLTRYLFTWGLAHSFQGILIALIWTPPKCVVRARWTFLAESHQPSRLWGDSAPAAHGYLCVRSFYSLGCCPSTSEAGQGPELG